MFKAVNKLAPEEINNLFMKQYEMHNHGTRSVEEGNLFLSQRNLNKGQEIIYPILVQKFGMKSLQQLRMFEYMLQSHVSSWGFPSTL